MEFYVEGTPKTKKYIEALLPSMLEQLKLTKNKKLLHHLVLSMLWHLQIKN